MYMGACIPDGAVGRESHTFDALESAVLRFVSINIATTASDTLLV
jgi:hypothetical protein